MRMGFGFATKQPMGIANTIFHQRNLRNWESPLCRQEMNDFLEKKLIQGSTQLLMENNVEGNL